MKASEFSNLIAECCAEVLDTMYFTSVLGTESPASQSLSPNPDTALSFSLSFVGDISGRFGLWLEPTAARSLAANFLGEEDSDVSPDDAAEVAGELANMFCGSVMSRVEREHTFVLSHPLRTDGPPFGGNDDFFVCELVTECGIILVWVVVEGEPCR
jgi:CheY-specific phosphatase CheX